MLLTRLKVVAALALILTLAGAGVGLIASHTPAADPPRTKPAARAAAPAAKKEPKDAVRPADLLKQAAEAAHSINDPSWKVWMLASVGQAQARAKEKDASAKTFADAIEAAKRIAGSERGNHLIDVAEARAQAGDIKGAKETVDLIEDDGNLGRRDVALSRIAIAQAAAGDLKGAEDTITSVSSDPWKGEALQALTAAQAKAGKIKEAARTAEDITDDLNRVVALLTLARAHRTAKDDKAAAKWLQDARKVVEGIEENEKSDTRAVADGALAEALAEAGEVRGARKLAGAIKKAMWKWSAVERVAAAQAKAGNYKGALETAGTIEDEPGKESAIKEVVSAQLRAGDRKGALKTFEALKRPYWRAEALIEVARAQAKAGDAAAARKTFDRAFEEAKGVEVKEGHGSNADNACYASIVRGMAEAGQEKEAAALAAEQTVPLRKAQALIWVAEVVLRKGAEKRPKGRE